MNCPNCDVPLTRTKYENVPVSQCAECQGYLVDRNRLLLIKRSHVQSSETLQSEAADQGRPDAKLQIPCPKCRSQRMRKERIQVTKEESFLLDICRKCNVVWFDGGELARMQIQYEKSAQALEAYAFRQREETRSDEEQKDPEQLFAELPKSQSILERAVNELLINVAVIVLAILTLYCWFSGYPTLSAVFSVPVALGLGWLSIDQLSGPKIRIGSVSLLMLLEIIFLVYVFFFH